MREKEVNTTQRIGGIEKCVRFFMFSYTKQHDSEWVMPFIVPL